MFWNFARPEVYQLDPDDQQALFYVAAKGGLMVPRPRTDYSHLIGLGYLKRQPGDGGFIPDRVVLTKAGDDALTRYHELLRKSGRMWTD